MIWILAALTLGLSAADHWTTWVCLRRPVSGWDVVEANPISDWLFQTVGLVPGLMLDSVITVVAIGFVIATPRMPNSVKAICLAFISSWTAYAVVNNYNAIEALGLSPMGIS